MITTMQAFSRWRASAASETNLAWSAEALQERFLDDVFRYVSRRLSVRAEAEDVTAETFAAAFSSLQQIQRQERPASLPARHRPAQADRPRSETEATARADRPRREPGRPRTLAGGTISRRRANERSFTRSSIRSSPNSGRRFCSSISRGFPKARSAPCWASRPRRSTLSCSAVALPWRRAARPTSFPSPRRSDDERENYSERSLPGPGAVRRPPAARPAYGDPARRRQTRPRKQAAHDPAGFSP